MVQVLIRNVNFAATKADVIEVLAQFAGIWPEDLQPAACKDL
jgi:hypothetical protein